MHTQPCDSTEAISSLTQGGEEKVVLGASHDPRLGKVTQEATQLESTPF